ncbi:MAG: diaminopimelate epimerase [Acetobacterales bacterium]
MDAVPFVKMHGLGNDFVVVDARARAFRPTPEQAQAIGDRRRGVGYDQLLIIEPPRNGAAQVFMRIINPDGSESGACGNGTRCVADLVMRGAGADAIVIETMAGPLHARRAEGGRITVDMGEVKTGWRDIPLAEERDTLHLGIGAGLLQDPVAVSLGNPHAVFFVDDPDAIDLAGLGPGLEHHPLFPERANIGVAAVRGADEIRLKVWERGAGLTLACGSGACAALVAAHRRGLAGRSATVTLPGGPLDIDWREDGHAWMTGAVATAFAGTLDPALLAS